MTGLVTSTVPEVSVLMTAYNRQDIIKEAIESVLSSEFEDFEFIVVDDCSNDGTFEVALSYAAHDDRVRAFKNEINLGDYPNRNKAASYAQGKYLKYLDSDDRIYPWGLGAFVQCMEHFPEAGFGLAARAEYDRPHPVLFSPREAYLEEYMGRELFGRAPGSAIIRRDAFETVGGFSGIRQLGDFEFWHKIGARYPLVTLPPALVWDGVYSGQEKLVNTDTDKAAMRAKIIRVALAAPECPLDAKEQEAALNSVRRRYGKTFWRLLLRRFDVFEAIAYRKTVLAQL